MAIAGKSTFQYNDFVVARFLGDSGFSAAAASLSAQGSPTPTVGLNTPLLAPLVTSGDHDLTTLATEVILSRPKRRGAFSR
jgi:hypothetical protein